MAVSKELANKIKKYQALTSEANKLFEEIEETFIEDEIFVDAIMDDFSVTTEVPQSIETTDDGEYNNITTRFEDSVWGAYYIPVEDSDEYVEIRYST